MGRSDRMQRRLRLGGFEARRFHICMSDILCCNCACKSTVYSGSHHCPWPIGYSALPIVSNQIRQNALSACGALQCPLAPRTKLDSVVKLELTVAPLRCPVDELTLAAVHGTTSAPCCGPRQCVIVSCLPSLALSCQPVALGGFRLQLGFTFF